MNRIIILLIASLLSGSTLLNAQTEVVVIDSITGFPSKGYDFDKSFPVRFFTKNKAKITSVALFGLDRKGCLKPYTCVKCRKDSSRKKSFQSFTIVFKQSVDSTQLDFNMPPLQPNSRYAVVISNIPKIPEFKQVLDLLHAGRADREIEAKVVYEEILNKYRYVYRSACMCCETAFEIEDFDSVKLHFARVGTYNRMDSASRYEQLLRQKKDEQINLEHTTLDWKPYEANLFNEIIIASEDCIKCKDTLWRQDIVERNERTVASLLISLDSLNRSRLVRGNAVLGEPDLIRSTEPLSLSKRKENLAKTATRLKNLDNLVGYMRYKKVVTEADAVAFQTAIRQVIPVLLANYQAIDIREKEIKQLAEELAMHRNFLDSLVSGYEGFTNFSSVLNPDTYTYNFETRSGFALKADFGFMVYGNPWNSPGLSGFSPFVGFHVNFRPMNTDLPFHPIPNKGILGHLSFNAGILLVSLSEENKRDGLLGKTSIFTGLGWAFGHAVRLSTGAVWFKKENINPLISRRSTAATPYLALSIDLRLKEIYDGFKKLFEP